MKTKKLWIVEGVLVVGGLAALVAAIAIDPRTDGQSVSTSEGIAQVGQDSSAPVHAITDETKSSAVTTPQATGGDGTANIISRQRQPWQESASTDGRPPVDNEIIPEAADDKKGGTMGSPAAINVDEAPIEDLIEALGRLKGEDLEKAILRLAKSGEAGFKLLLAELQHDGQTFGFRHRTVRVLEMMNTPESRNVLKDMALGNHTSGNPNLERWAAQAYLACAQDQRAAVDLLESTAGPVLNLALLRLRGLSPDASLMRRLEQLSESSERAVRIATALVLADDPDPRSPSDAVKLIAAAALVASSERDATQNPGHGYYTKAEREYSVYVNALSTMKATNESLRRQAAEEKGPGRDLLHIALGRRGDDSARSALVDILKQSDNGMIRAWAAAALGLVGTRADLALLNQLKESDPDVRKGTTGPLGPVTVRPVRKAAAKAIRDIEKRATEK